jgi:hypothetical protein
VDVLSLPPISGNPAMMPRPKPVLAPSQLANAASSSSSSPSTSSSLRSENGSSAPYSPSSPTVSDSESGNSANPSDPSHHLSSQLSDMEVDDTPAAYASATEGAILTGVEDETSSSSETEMPPPPPPPSKGKGKSSKNGRMKGTTMSFSKFLTKEVPASSGVNPATPTATVVPAPRMVPAPAIHVVDPNLPFNLVVSPSANSSQAGATAPPLTPDEMEEALRSGVIPDATSST